MGAESQQKQAKLQLSIPVFEDKEKECFPLNTAVPAGRASGPRRWGLASNEAGPPGSCSLLSAAGSLFPPDF